MKIDQSIFRAYDIRGTYPDQINEKVAYRIGQAFATMTKSDIVVGRDVRNSSDKLFKNLTRGVNSLDYNVTDLGICTTPMLNFAVANKKFKGGMMVTASHNPPEYNGVKLIGPEALQLTLDNGIDKIRDIVLEDQFALKSKKGIIERYDILSEYIDWITAKVPGIKKYKIVVDAGNSVGAIPAERAFERIGADIIPLYFQPDGNYPNHLPDPMEQKNLSDVIEKVKESRADFGIAFDGDADRAGFVDENGESIDPGFLLAAIANCELKDHPNEKIYYDLRFSRSVPESIKKDGGIPVKTKVGNPNYKRQLINEGGLMGAEYSGHFMYQENYCIDDGLFSVLKVLYWLSKKNCRLSDFVNRYRRGHYLFSTNVKVKDTKSIIKNFEEKYSDGKIEEFDGVTIEYPDWWFVFRASNTEPVVRINIEANSQELLDEKKEEILAVK